MPIQNLFAADRGDTRWTSVSAAAAERSCSTRVPTILALSAGLLLSLLLPGAAAAVTRTWTGAANNAWEDDRNWSPPLRPQNGDDLVFDARGMNRTMVSNMVGLTLRSLTFTDGGYSLGSSLFTLTDGITSSIGANPGDNVIHVASPGLFLNRAQTWTVRSGRLVLANGMELNGALTFDIAAGATVEIQEPTLLGRVSGTGGIVKGGAGTLEMLANSTYEGPTIINAGFVVIGGTLGIADGTIANGTTVNAGGSLVLRDSGLDDEALVLNGAGQAGTGALQGTTPRGYFLSGPMTLATDVSCHFVAGSTAALGGPISGPGGLGLGGPAFYNLMNGMNTFAGGVRWGAIGTADSQLLIEADNALPRTTVLDIPAAGDFFLARHANTVAGLAGAGTVELGGGVLTVDQAVSTTFRGNLGGGGRLVKAGGLVLTWNGTATPDVAVEVQRGLLGVPGGTLGPVSVGTLGRLALSRNGSAGAVTVERNGRLGGAPAGSGRSGALLLKPQARFLAVLAGRAQDMFTAVNVTGAVTLSNAVLTVTLSGFIPNVGESFTIVANDGADRVTGTFAGLPEGGTLTAGSRRLRVSYVGGTGNDVVLTVVP